MNEERFAWALDEVVWDDEQPDAPPLPDGKTFDPHQLRDSRGRWTTGGLGGGDISWQAGRDAIAKTAPGTATFIGLQEDAIDKIGAPSLPADKYAYRSTGNLLLREGRAWNVQNPEGKPTSAEYTPFRGPLGGCFENAGRPIFTRDQSLPPGTRYVEGYADAGSGGYPPIPVHHAWLVDKDDNVQEVTWPQKGTEYVGVEVNPQHLSELILNTGVWGVLDHYELGFPELKQDWKQANEA